MTTRGGLAPVDLLGEAEERALFAALAGPGRDAARDALVLHNHPLVAWVIRQHRLERRGMPYEDLYQEGLAALCRTVDRFDPARGTRLCTVAVPWVRQALRAAVEDGRYPVRVPRYLRCRDAGHVPTTPGGQRRRAEIQARAKSIRSARVVSVDEPGVVVPAPEAEEDDEDDDERARERVALRAAVAGLPDRERQVIARRFGLDGHGERSLRKVGAEFGLTKERVRQIEVEALDRLRDVMTRKEAD